MARGDSEAERNEWPKTCQVINVLGLEISPHPKLVLPIAKLGGSYPAIENAPFPPPVVPSTINNSTYMECVTTSRRITVEIGTRETHHCLECQR